MTTTHSDKKYQCSKCGHITTQNTNHYGNTWSWGRFNCCPKCPPHAKYSEYGGQTIWVCLDKEPSKELSRCGDFNCPCGTGEPCPKEDGGASTGIKA